MDDETGEVTVLKLVQVYDVGRAINPTLVEGQIEGGAVMGLGLGLLEACYPFYPSVEHRGGEFGAYLAPSMEGLPELDNVIIENPSADGPFGAKAIGEMANNAQPPAIVAAIHDAVGAWVTELPATPERVLRALEASSGAAPRREASDLRRGARARHRVEGRRRGLLGRRCLSRRSGPGTAATAFELVDGVHLHAIGGDQVLLCRVQYEPGKQVAWHAHEHTEQVMFILDGAVELTIEEETQTLRTGDVVVVNRGLHHKLYSEEGVTFIEALAPVPLDHVPDRTLDLVLGTEGGSQHVEK